MQQSQLLTYESYVACASALYILMDKIIFHTHVARNNYLSPTCTALSNYLQNLEK